MENQLTRTTEPKSKDKYCYKCKAYGHWRRDCNIKHTNQEEKTSEIGHRNYKTIKKQYTKEGNIATLTTNKTVKEEEVKYSPGKTKAQEHKSIQTEETIAKKNETVWAKEKEEHLKRISTLTNQLNEEKLQHTLTKNQLEFAIFQRYTE